MTEDFAKTLKTSPDDECLEKLKEISNKESILNYVYRKEDYKGNRVEGENEEELWGHNLLHLAVCFNKIKTAKHLFQTCPQLITKDIGEYPESKKDYFGLTPFHLAVAQGNLNLVKGMLPVIAENYKVRLLQGKYSDNPTEIPENEFGKRTEGTVLMGHLPLTVAVLSYINHTEQTDEDDSNPDDHFEIIETFLDPNGPEFHLDEANYLGDTVFHSIMRFVNCFPSKQAKAKQIISRLDSRMQDTFQSNDSRRALYFLQNNDGQTALQLAANYAHTDLFRQLLQLKDVYHIGQPHDNVYEIARYDVTEIDRLALRKSRIRRKVTGGLCFQRYSKQQSVAELICSRRSLDNAITMIHMDVFEAFISRKWSRYRLVFLVFFLFHLFNVVLLNIHIVARGTEVVGRSFGPTNLEIGLDVYFLLIGLFYIIQEFWRFFVAEQQFSFRSVHHNVVYRFCLLITGLILLVDSVLGLIPSVQNNWFLAFAVIASTWFLLFFLRGCPYFSVYIVLINDALFKAVLPFAILIFLQLFAFSSCMHSFFLDLEQDALEDPEKVAFENYGKAALTMGKLMVGLTEVENLLSSNQDVLAVIAFTIYVIITFLLMVNALVGVMTNKFTDTQTSKVQVTYLQKLSIIIFLEGWCFRGEPVGQSAIYTDSNSQKSSSQRKVGGKRTRRVSDIPKSQKDIDKPESDKNTPKRQGAQQPGKRASPVKSDENGVLKSEKVSESKIQISDKKDDDGASNTDKGDSSEQNNANERSKEDTSVYNKTMASLGERYVFSFRRVPSNQADQPSNIEHKLSRSHNILKEIQKNIDEIMENQRHRISGPKRLHVYHYSKQ